MQCPGGHLEYGESFAETAARESLEETGLEIGNIKFLTATNDVFGEGKHYVTIFVTAEITGENKIAQVGQHPYLEEKQLQTSRDKNEGFRGHSTDSLQAMEPHKCAKWEWIPWSQMWAWAGEQAEAEKNGIETKKQMFLPLVNLWRERPELKDALKRRR